MSNIYDYLTWRGDLPFSRDPFNEVDALIFSWISYYEFEKFDREEIVGRKLQDIIGLHEERFAPIDIKDTEKTIVTSISSIYLMKWMAGTARFSDTVLNDFSSHYDPVKSIQFAAASFGISDTREVVAFRGTDTSVAGWKEDCKLCYEEALPAQVEALSFLNRQNGSGRIVITGHSKGGNLSLYAAMKADRGVAERIDSIYNYDGPGFCFDIKETENYPLLSGRIRSFLRPASIVGILLEHVEDYAVVENSSVGIHQHFPVFWIVRGNTLVRAEKRTGSSQMIDSIFSAWIRKVSFSERKDFVETLFAVLEKAGIEDFTELSTDGFQKMKAILSQMATMDSEKRKMVTYFLSDFLKIGGNSIISSLKQRPRLK